MATIMKLIGANFSGRGLPNIKPFIDEQTLSYAYDFRDSTLTDYTGNTTLRALRNDIATNQKMVEDYSIISQSADGLGIVIEMGCLELSEILAPIPLGGSEQFTVMVVGGYSGNIFDPEKVVGSNATICSLFDYGTGITASGFSLEVAGDFAGSRIEDGTLLLKSSLPDRATPCCLFLTFNGNSWTLINKTLSTTQAKTNTELDITNNPLGINNLGSNKVKLGGHYHSTSTLAALAPVLYQSARWDKVLSPAEIDEQYARTQATFGVLGL